ncbi:hypothetical protein L873DRAFT_371028 [Choiromyces venosus 120613-1]|uniref:Uncharacterized protein n=1 Tax=Choiromyces venosus 120613-1 TaxID=1336337 RepID=A0A3N4IYJ5_9PEZI|nr:hypothetical protein L873DRAFT_371028 [Choiromyces venosus 120613-1]
MRARQSEPSTLSFPVGQMWKFLALPLLNYKYLFPPTPSSSLILTLLQNSPLIDGAFSWCSPYIAHRRGDITPAVFGHLGFTIFDLLLGFLVSFFLSSSSSFWPQSEGAKLMLWEEKMVLSSV